MSELWSTASRLKLMTSALPGFALHFLHALTSCILSTLFLPLWMNWIKSPTTASLQAHASGNRNMIHAHTSSESPPNNASHEQDICASIHVMLKMSAEAQFFQQNMLLPVPVLAIFDPAHQHCQAMSALQNCQPKADFRVTLSKNQRLWHSLFRDRDMKKGQTKCGAEQLRANMPWARNGGDHWTTPEFELGLITVNHWMMGCAICFSTCSHLR